MIRHIALPPPPPAWFAAIGVFLDEREADLVRNLHSVSDSISPQQAIKLRQIAERAANRCGALTGEVA